MGVADLRAEFERAGGRDLRWFFDQWFFRRGAPEFVLSTQTVARGEQWEVKGSIRQVCDVYRVTAEIAFVKGGSREVRQVDIAERDTDFSVLLPFRPDAVLFDPEYKILRWIDEFETEPGATEMAANAVTRSGATPTTVTGVPLRRMTRLRAVLRPRASASPTNPFDRAPVPPVGEAETKLNVGISPGWPCV